MSRKKPNPVDVFIRTEKDAWRLLQDVIGKELPADNFNITFDSWPVLEVKLEGDSFDASISTKMMESFIELQRLINNNYARIRHNRTRARALTDEERNDLEVMVTVKQGSSLLEVNLDHPLSKLAQGVTTTMDGTQMTVAILGCALAIASTVCIKAYIKKQQENKASDERIALSELETQRLKIFTDAINHNNQLKQINEDAEHVHNSILRSAAQADRTTIAGVKLSQDEIKELIRPVRRRSEEVQLNGQYKVVAIDNTNPDHYKVDLEFEDGRTFPARLDQRFVATKEQNRRLIENALWNRTPVFLLVKANDLQGEITKATIVDVRDRYIKGMHDVKR